MLRFSEHEISGRHVVEEEGGCGQDPTRGSSVPQPRGDAARKSRMHQAAGPSTGAEPLPLVFIAVEPLTWELD